MCQACLAGMAAVAEPPVQVQAVPDGVFCVRSCVQPPKTTEGNKILLLSVSAPTFFIVCLCFFGDVLFCAPSPCT